MKTVTERTVEGRVIYSKDVLTSIVSLTNENPFGKTSIMKTKGGLKLSQSNGFLQISYTGEEYIAKRLETYIGMVNKAQESMTSKFPKLAGVYD